MCICWLIWGRQASYAALVARRKTRGWFGIRGLTSSLAAFPVSLVSQAAGAIDKIRSKAPRQTYQAPLKRSTSPLDMVLLTINQAWSIRRPAEGSYRLSSRPLASECCLGGGGMLVTTSAPRDKPATLLKDDKLNLTHSWTFGVLRIGTLNISSYHAFSRLLPHLLFSVKGLC